MGNILIILVVEQSLQDCFSSHVYCFEGMEKDHFKLPAEHGKHIQDNGCLDHRAPICLIGIEFQRILSKVPHFTEFQGILNIFKCTLSNSWKTSQENIFKLMGFKASVCKIIKIQMTCRSTDDSSL